MRSSLVLSIPVALLLGGCIAEPRVHSAAVPPTVDLPAKASPSVPSPTVAAPAFKSPGAAPRGAAPAASTLCGGLSAAEEARCLHVIDQDVARIGAAEAGQLRAVMRQVAIQQARLDDPGRSVRCGESTVDGQLVTTCIAAPRR